MDLSKTYFLPTSNVFFHNDKFYSLWRSKTHIEEDDESADDNAYLKIENSIYFPVSFDQQQNAIVMDVSATPILRKIVWAGYKDDEDSDDYMWDTIDEDMVTYGKNELPYIEPEDEDELESLIRNRNLNRLLA